MDDQTTRFLVPGDPVAHPLRDTPAAAVAVGAAGRIGVVGGVGGGVGGVGVGVVALLLVQLYPAVERGTASVG